MNKKINKKENKMKNINTITMTELFEGRTKLNKLKRDIKESYEHDIRPKNLIAERNTLKKRFKLEETIIKETNVRNEYSHGADKWEKRIMTFNVKYQPLTDYGSFEIYSSCGEYYAEGGLWFDKGELTDYDGCFSLSNEVRKQLDNWGLDTSYLGSVESEEK